MTLQQQASNTLIACRKRHTVVSSTMPARDDPVLGHLLPSSGAHTWLMGRVDPL